jgi:hypothetical protein
MARYWPLPLAVLVLLGRTKLHGMSSAAKTIASVVAFAALVCSWQPASAQFIQQGSKIVGTGAIGAAEQGESVALSSDGNTLIVGGPSDNSNAGAAWVFTRSGSVWTQQAELVGAGAVYNSSEQGYSVGISADGNTAIVGGPNDDASVGAAWVFVRSGAVWTLEAKLIGTGAKGFASQGYSVGLSGDGNTAIVGGPYDDFISGVSYIGAAWVFTRSGGVWTQQAKLVGTGMYWSTESLASGKAGRYRYPATAAQRL